MIIYRYLSLDHGLDTLQKERIKVGRLEDLNDPFDCFPRLINISPITDGDDADSHARRFLRRYTSQLGVLCYSAKLADPVIWSQYSDAHKGIALGFDYPPGNASSPIQYQDERIELDVMELNRANESKNSAALMEILRKAFSVKALSWRYEEEYRRFITLDRLFLCGRNYFELMPWFNLKEVIIGARSPIERCDMIRCLEGRANENVSQKIIVKKARMSPTKHEMLIED
jgi:hypothetical protein